MDIQLFWFLVSEAAPIALLGIIGWGVDRIYRSVRITGALIDQHLNGHLYNMEVDMGDAVEVIPPDRSNY